MTGYFLNLDFIYYLIYLFFRSIFGGIFGFGSNNLNKKDSDGDGIPDSADADVDGNGVIDAGKSDFDGDGIVDRADSDVNNDGVIDNPPDVDGNGIKDTFESTFENSDFNIIDLLNYLTNSDYKVAGDGLGSFYDGYSLFTPPHGIESWGDGFFNSFSNWLANFLGNPYCPNCSSFFDMIFGGWNLLFWLLSMLVVILFFFLKDKEKRLADLEWEKYEKVFEKDEVNSGSKKTQRWENILGLIESTNKNDWKAAIMDADNLLDEIMIEQGFVGVNLGERLKSSNFDTLQNAWEAHKIRNNIAHDSSFDLTKREAKRAIQNYSLVFNEFYYL